jgi:hypothetical protein
MFGSIFMVFERDEWSIVTKNIQMVMRRNINVLTIMLETSNELFLLLLID